MGLRARESRASPMRSRTRFMGVDPGAVRVVTGDTEARSSGMGIFGSRSVVLGGSAVAQAAQVVRERALRAAAALLEAAAVDLEMRDGRVAVLGAARAVGRPCQRQHRGAGRDWSYRPGQARTAGVGGRTPTPGRARRRAVDHSSAG